MECVATTSFVRSSSVNPRGSSSHWVVHQRKSSLPTTASGAVEECWTYFVSRQPGMHPLRQRMNQVDSSWIHAFIAKAAEDVA